MIKVKETSILIIICILIIALIISVRVIDAQYHQNSDLRTQGQNKSLPPSVIEKFSLDETLSESSEDSDPIDQTIVSDDANDIPYYDPPDQGVPYNEVPDDPEWKTHYFDKEGLVVRWELLEELDNKTGTESKDLQVIKGSTLKIPGFMIPLEDDLNEVTEFLLVPFPMACIHVPAPPPNQIIHVKMKKSIKMSYYEPIWVYGSLKIEKTKNIYTDVSYLMTGTKSAMFTDWTSEIENTAQMR